MTANVPVSDIAEDMFKVVEKFQSKSKHVQQVHVVIYQADMMKDFMDAIQKCVSNTKEKGYVEKLFGWTGLVGGNYCNNMIAYCLATILNLVAERWRTSQFTEVGNTDDTRHLILYTNKCKVIPE